MVDDVSRPGILLVLEALVDDPSDRFGRVPDWVAGPELLPLSLAVVVAVPVLVPVFVLDALPVAVPVDDEAVGKPFSVVAVNVGRSVWAKATTEPRLTRATSRRSDAGCSRCCSIRSIVSGHTRNRKLPKRSC